ncbi:hypothetical protein JTE90_026231 [Oedothorax gibbosus]|uniref:F-box domain-containing protein n=1 Tax=Oedothorax gibbosus TaxID=931172 RepID=A0AAV6U8U2_9ARAC|nr:hypothetical protein JTE90_026231 [Oedothorax gibbosus]
MESDLPFEVLCEILSYLDVRHRLVASLVCRRWLLACSTQLKDACLFLYRRSLPPPLQIKDITLPTLPLTRPFCKVALENINVDQQCMDFLKNLGPQLLHLEVSSSAINLDCCSWMKCPQLSTLVTDTEDIVMAIGPDPLVHLQSLDLYRATDVKDEMLLGLMDAVSPNLREFKVPRNVAFDRRVMKRFYPVPFNLCLDLSPFLLTTWAVELFIAKRAKTLTSLRLPPDTPEDAALRIASTLGLALTDVDISDCNGLRGSLGEFFKLQPRVVALNLFRGRIDYEELESVVRLLPGLRKLSIGCGFDKQALTLVFTLRHLRCLCIRNFTTSNIHCNKIPPEVFSTFASVDLRVLDVDASLDDESIQELLKRAPALRELKMGRIGRKFFRDGPEIRSSNHRY